MMMLNKIKSGIDGKPESLSYKNKVNFWK